MTDLPAVVATPGIIQQPRGRFKRRHGNRVRKKQLFTTEATEVAEGRRNDSRDSGEKKRQKKGVCNHR